MRCKKHYCEEDKIDRLTGDMHYARTGGRYYDQWICAASMPDYAGRSRLVVSPILLCKQHSAERLLPTLDLDPESAAKMNGWAQDKLRQYLQPRPGVVMGRGADKRRPQHRRYKPRR